jgi:hypothetical protein
MSDDNRSILVLLFWVLALVILLARAWSDKRPVAGITLAYWFQLWLIHWLGGFLHAFLGYKGQAHAAAITGFQLTGYAILGLLVGNLIAGRSSSSLTAGPISPTSAPESVRLPRAYIVIGLTAYFVLTPLLSYVPSLVAMTSSGVRLATAGWCLLWFVHWKEGRRSRAWLVVTSMAILPASTVLLQGFIGFGIMPYMTLACLVAVFYRPRAVTVGVGLAAVFLGLSLFPTYAHVRQEIRKSVWGGASYGDRLNKMFLLASNWQWFDAEKPEQLKAIDQRLNQNILVGSAIDYLAKGRTDFAHGKTLWYSVLALVPRAIWPDKPVGGGSQGLASQFTGIKFARGTSVGIGHVMELYVNFGWGGVLVGYVVIGMILGWIDVRAGEFLVAGDWRRFALWYVPGLSLLNVGGNFAEVTASALASLILCYIVNSCIAPTPVPIQTSGRHFQTRHQPKVSQV